MASGKKKFKPNDLNAPLDKLWKRFAICIIRRWGRLGFFSALVIYLAWALLWDWKDIKEKPFVSSMIEVVESTFSSTPAPIPGYFNVAIARLKNDQDDETRTELATELQKFATKFNELGTKEIRSVEVVPVPFKISLDNEVNHAEIREGHRQARNFLKKHGYDVLIWGLVRKKESFLPSLYWTTLAHEDAYHNLTSSISDEKLPEISVSDLTIVLRALIATRSQAFTEQQELYVADKIRSFINELQALLNTSEDKQGWNAKALQETRRALADALQTLGEQAGLNEPLTQAIKLYRVILQSTTTRDDPIDRADIQNNLGNALSILGGRESSTARLEEAIRVYREALQERTREKVPLDWAETQNNLGNALRALGEREFDTARLEEAVRVYHEALQEWTRKKVPLDWAKTQNNLGNVLQELGAREFDTARLEEAIRVYREAQLEYTRERVPLQWAMIQNNLGNALRALGERESGTARLEEAAKVLREALQEQTREKGAVDWAETQNNLGNVLRALGERESGTVRLEEAVRVLREALQERTREKGTVDWAETQNNLGNALRALGERESGTARLEEAVKVLCEALQERTRERVPLDWAETQNNLGNALRVLGELESGTVRLEQAIRAYNEALAVWVTATVPNSWKSSIKENIEHTQVEIRKRRGSKST
jgi:tetratricopeptide (TPR) repeat protein